MINPYLTYIGNPNAPAPVADTDPRSKVYSGGPLVQRPQPGMFSTPYAPMYQPPQQTGVSSVIERLQSGMGEDYTSRLLGNLNLPSASQFAAMAPPQQPAFNPYAQMYNPYAGMFETLLARIAQLEGARRDGFNLNSSNSDTTQTGWEGMDSVGPSFGLGGFLSEVFGGGSNNGSPASDNTTDSAYDSGSLTDEMGSF